MNNFNLAFFGADSFPEDGRSFVAVVRSSEEKIRDEDCSFPPYWVLGIAGYEEKGVITASYEDGSFKWDKADWKSNIARWAYLPNAAE